MTESPGKDLSVGLHSHLPHEKASSAFTAEMHGHMRTMVAAMDGAQLSGDPDRDFLMMMIPHHQSAVDMARSLLVHGRDPITRQIAEEIISGQGTEIAGMLGRLRDMDSGRDDYPTLGGTRGLGSIDGP